MRGQQFSLFPTEVTRNDDQWAIISSCGQYRYRMGRTIDKSNSKLLLWVMLNPSTADDEKNDNTTTKCEGFTAHLGYGKLEIVNLFAFRTKSPKVLRDKDFPDGPDNDKHIKEAIQACDGIVMAWGAINRFEPILIARRNAVREMVMKSKDVPIIVLARTMGGDPWHPLMLKYDTVPEFVRR